MYSNLNPRTMGMNHHPYEKLRDAAVKHGFQGIEVPAHAFGSVKAAQEEGKRLESLGLRWGLMMTPCDMFKVPDDEFETGLEQWARCASCRLHTRLQPFLARFRRAIV